MNFPLIANIAVFVILLFVLAQARPVINSGVWLKKCLSAL